MKFHLIKLCFLCVLLVSCNTSKEIVYFQDIVVNQPEAIIGARDITVQPKDQILFHQPFFYQGGIWLLVIPAICNVPTTGKSMFPLSSNV